MVKRTSPVRSDASARTLAGLVRDFLDTLQQANQSPHTVRAYASDLAQFTAFYTGAPGGINAEILRAFWQSLATLSSATRSRKQACLARFLTWAYRQDHIPANPMDKIERVKHEPPAPCEMTRDEVEKILAIIPAHCQRDRLLFRLLLETGLRIGEALGMQVDDLDLTPEEEHIHVRGTGSDARVLLLDDPGLVRQIQRYLQETGYRCGPLFRAVRAGDGGAIRYPSVRERWNAYCQEARVLCTLHQLRQLHATELAQGGVSLTTIRKRLGYKALHPPLDYVDPSDAVTDAEIRAWRRARNANSSDS